MANIFALTVHYNKVPLYWWLLLTKSNFYTVCALKVNGGHRGYDMMSAKLALIWLCLLS